LAAASTLAACHTASRQTSRPMPEEQQVIGERIKELYMKVSMAPARSPQQQKLILSMAGQAANGKELLLVMRAANGVFAAKGPDGNTLEQSLLPAVTVKMMEVATLEQLIDYAVEYPIGSRQARRLAERIFELGDENRDSRVWHRIKAAAYHLGTHDLERQAQVRAEQLAPGSDR